jgi:transposase
VASRGVAEDQGGALTRGAWLCFLDESGASLTPPVRRTWAPVGHTPILRHRMRGRKRISMAGVCCYRPDATDARLAFHLREGAYDTDQLIPIMQALGRLLGGTAPVILIWDNLPAHTSLAMHAWLAAQHAWLQVEYLPPYAPDLNPVEGLWANLKGVELANRACGSLEELAAAAEQGIGRVRGEPELLFSFLHQAGLSL